MPRKSLYTPKQRAYILDLYKLSEENSVRAERMYLENMEGRITSSTIRNIWREAGYNTAKQQKYSLGFDEAFLREMFNKYGGDVTQMANYNVLGPSVRTIVSRCNKLGLGPLINVPKGLVKKVREHNNLAPPPEYITPGTKHSHRF